MQINYKFGHRINLKYGKEKPDKVYISYNLNLAHESSWWLSREGVGEGRRGTSFPGFSRLVNTGLLTDIKISYLGVKRFGSPPLLLP